MKNVCLSGTAIGMDWKNYLMRVNCPPNDTGGCVHNAHMFYLKARDLEERTALISYLKEQGVQAVFHYIPLHTAPAGQRYGVFAGEDRYTTREARGWSACRYIIICHWNRQTM